jgi:hypothetical protein
MVNFPVWGEKQSGVKKRSACPTKTRTRSQLQVKLQCEQHCIYGLLLLLLEFKQYHQRSNSASALGSAP